MGFPGTTLITTNTMIAAPRSVVIVAKSRPSIDFNGSMLIKIKAGVAKEAYPKNGLFNLLTLGTEGERRSYVV